MANTNTLWKFYFFQIAAKPLMQLKGIYFALFKHSIQSTCNAIKHEQNFVTFLWIVQNVNSFKILHSHANNQYLHNILQYDLKFCTNEILNIIFAFVDKILNFTFHNFLLILGSYTPTAITMFATCEFS